ncbi:MAG: response regulator [Oscillospiraceae bacterium]|nr:response regulator [Oscillospiraceae bacterium]
MRVLVVQNNLTFNRGDLRDVLTRFCGINSTGVFAAKDGEDALRKHAELKPMLVFLDISLPSKNALATARALRKENPSVRTIMCTASKQDPDVLKCIKFGTVDFVLTPPTPKNVRLAVKEVESDLYSEWFFERSATRIIESSAQEGDADSAGDEFYAAAPALLW